MTDKARIVSLDIPSGWADGTRSDARQIETVSESNSGGPHRVPDIEASKVDVSKTGLGPSSFIKVTVDLQPYNSKPAILHQQVIDNIEQGHDPTESSPTTRSATISGQPAITTTFRGSARSDFPASIRIITTITTGTYVVAVVGDTDDPVDPDGATLTRLIGQLRVDG